MTEQLHKTYTFVKNNLFLCKYKKCICGSQNSASQLSQQRWLRLEVIQLQFMMFDDECYFYFFF